MNVLIVFLGGGLGSVSRYLLSESITNFFKILFPIGTFFVNITGCFIIGFLFTLFEELVAPAHWRLLLLTGFLGGFTTFSSFGLETTKLIKEQQFLAAAGNAVMSVVLGLIFVLLGMLLATILIRKIK